MTHQAVLTHDNLKGPALQQFPSSRVNREACHKQSGCAPTMTVFSSDAESLLPSVLKSTGA